MKTYLLYFNGIIFCHDIWEYRRDEICSIIFHWSSPGSPSTINVLLDISVTQTTEKVQAQGHKPVQSLIKPKLWRHYCMFALWLLDLTHIGSLCNWLKPSDQRREGSNLEQIFFLSWMTSAGMLSGRGCTNADSIVGNLQKIELSDALFKKFTVGSISCTVYSTARTWGIPINLGNRAIKISFMNAYYSNSLKFQIILVAT